MNLHFKHLLFALLCLIFGQGQAQSNKQKGLLWQISGNGLKKPSYVYGTMHVSQKIAFHLGDSFYIALSKADIVALEQDLDSVIHRWISESDFSDPDDANKVSPRHLYEFLNMSDFTLNTYNRFLIKRKLSAEVREVNYLLKRGDQDDFEEDAWLDLYIYQIAKKLGKGFTGVEGYEESRDLVKKASEEPKDAKGKKPKRFNFKLRTQVSEAYRKGDIFMIDSIDRLTETEHYLEYMLYKRNANMVRRMDSIMRQGKVMFTGVGCSHLPGTKGVLQMLIEKGYKVRPVQSIALEKSSMAKKYEKMQYSHKYQTYQSEDGLLSAKLPTRLTKVNDNSSYSSYLSPDLANGHYYQIEKISCNSVFSGQTPEDILLVIDTLIFENIPGEIQKKINIVSNGYKGIEVHTRLKTGDINRFQILASPFNIYIIRMAGKKDFAVSSDANQFFKSIKINEGNAGNWKHINSPDSIFQLEMPTYENGHKLQGVSAVNPSFEHLVFESSSGNTYLVKQMDILNMFYLEQDTTELLVMARSFAKTDNYKIRSMKHFDFEGYHALDAVYTDKNEHELVARFFICGTRYIMLAMKPGASNKGFGDRFFTSFHFNGKPSYQFFEYKDTSFNYTVNTPYKPYEPKSFSSMYNYYGAARETDNDSISELFKTKHETKYFTGQNANEFICVSMAKLSRYEQIEVEDEEKLDKEAGSLKLLRTQKRNENGIRYSIRYLTDTNTTRQVIAMSVYKGDLAIGVFAFLDTVKGKSAFVDEFMKSFTLLDIPEKNAAVKRKSSLFFKDFSSGDSVFRKNAIKNFHKAHFKKDDIPDLCKVIDTININGDAGRIRQALLNSLCAIDSAQDQIVPYLQKLYTRFTDTAYMQLEILKCLAMQKCDKGFKVIKPILAEDVPISSEEYEMSSMLYMLGDSLKLTKAILPELIELTGIPEYRSPAYDLIRRMKDSGIITELDYASLHNKLVHETKLEYKRVLAAITSFKGGSEEPEYGEPYYEYENLGNNSSDWTTYPPAEASYSYYDNYGNKVNAGTLADLFDLTLPLRTKNKTIEELVGKVLKFTNNDVRLDLIPVLLKYNIDYADSVYESLAANKKTSLKFYTLLWEMNKLSKFPSQYKNQQHFVIAEIESSIYSKQKIESYEILEKREITLNNQNGVVYICKYKIEEEDEEMLYISSLMSKDTSLYYVGTYSETDNEYGATYAYSADQSLYNQAVPSNQELSEFLDEFFFKKFVVNARRSNGGYFYFDYDSSNYDYGMYEDYDY